MAVKKNVISKKIKTVSIIYILIMLIMTAAAIAFPRFFNRTLSNEWGKVDHAVEVALNESSLSQTRAKLDDLNDDFNMDIVILSEKEIIYQTIDEVDFKVLDTIVTDKTSEFKTNYLTSANGTEYQVWYALYTESASDLLLYNIYMILGGIVLSSILIITLIRIFSQQLITPLELLKRNISKLLSYDLSEISQQEDILNSEDYDVFSGKIGEFASDLDERLSKFGESYTALEENLIIKNEVDAYKATLVSSLVHELKTPLNIVQMYEENMIGLLERGMDIKEVQEKLVKAHHELLFNINEILHVNNLAEKDVYSLQSKETFDMMKLVRETLKSIEPIFRERGVIVEIDAPFELEVEMNRIEVKQIFYNVFSNAAYYTDENGNFELEIADSDDEIIIRTYNTKADSSKIDFEHAFDLFYTVSTKGTLNKGTGVGMAMIKTIVEKHDGEVSFYPVDGGIALNMLMKK